MIRKMYALLHLVLIVVPLGAFTWTQTSWQVPTNTMGSTFSGLTTDDPTVTLGASGSTILTRTYTGKANEKLMLDFHGQGIVTTGSITVSVFTFAPNQFFMNNTMFSGSYNSTLHREVTAWH